MPTYQDELLKRAGAMVRQTQAEGSTPFAGSTYDASATRVTPLAPVTTLITTPAPTLQQAPAYVENPADKALREFQEREGRKALDLSQQTINEDQLRSDALAQFQAEINAQNAVYADKLARAQEQGRGRLGTIGAIQARRGLLGSDFATTQTAGVEGANEAILGSIENEKQAVIQSILNKGKEMGQRAIAEKRVAQEGGTKAYLDFLKGRVEGGNKTASEIAKSFLATQAPLESYDPASIEAIATNAGVSVGQIKRAYEEQKKIQEAEVTKEADKKLESVKTQMEIDRINQQIASGQRDANKPIEVGGYIYKPDGQGNWVNSGVKVGGVSSTTGTYTPGENRIVDSWAERIQNGTAKITEIPSTQAGLRNQVTVALQAMGNSTEGKPTTTELGKAALSTAKDLLSKFETGGGYNNAVGASIYPNRFAVPGTQRSDFIIGFNSLKSQLALEAVKYLKGQGAVSDAERALLSQAATRLNLSQSEDEFKKTLQDIVSKLEGNSISGSTNTVVAPDGQQVEIID